MELASTMWREGKLAARSLFRNKGLSTLCVLTITVGLGMNLQVFSIVNTVVLEPIGFDEQDRVVILWKQDVTRDSHPHEISFPNFPDWRARSSALTDMAAMGSDQRQLKLPPDED